MRTNKRKSYLMVFLLASIASTPLAAKSKKKLLNRSIYMPIDFELCEHLAEGTSTRTTASCPRCPQGVCSSSRITPTVRSSCPSKVRVRVEGNYLADDEPFTAELSVTVQGIHTAHGLRSADTKVQLLKQRKKIDTRLEKRTIRLACKRYCKRERHVAAP